MKTYGDLRKALQRHPTSWTLREELPDDTPIPPFPVMLEKVPRARRRRVSREAVAGRLRRSPPSDPRLLVHAVGCGLLSRAEAERYLRRTWGEGFSLGDFTPVGNGP